MALFFLGEIAELFPELYSNVHFGPFIWILNHRKMFTLVLLMT